MRDPAGMGGINGAVHHWPCREDGCDGDRWDSSSPTKDTLLESTDSGRGEFRRYEVKVVTQSFVRDVCPGA